MKKTLGLGRGLDALIDTTHVATAGSSSISEIAIDKIYANPDQPRHTFDEEALQELAQSIRDHGVISPITLRKDANNRYMIIAGERRWRASQMAGIQRIPAYIRTADDENMMQMALVENIQREELNPIEVALAYQHLIERYNLKQEELSEKIGKNRATIANTLRLLKLPAQVQMAIKNRQIDKGHARALLSLADPAMQVKFFKEVLEKGYSVRQIEEMVAQINAGEAVKSGKRTLQDKKVLLPEEFKVLKTQLSDFFKTKVQMTCSQQGKGKISIPFENEEELTRIIELFDKMRS